MPDKYVSRFANGEISYKQWKQARAAKLGMKLHTLEVRIARGQHPRPVGARRGPTGRIIGVAI